MRKSKSGTRTTSNVSRRYAYLCVTKFTRKPLYAADTVQLLGVSVEAVSGKHASRSRIQFLDREVNTTDADGYCEARLKVVDGHLRFSSMRLARRLCIYHFCTDGFIGSLFMKGEMISVLGKHYFVLLGSVTSVSVFAIYGDASDSWIIFCRPR